MRVTLDTNVLVSAFISKHGHSSNILDMIATFPEIELVLSEQIIEEFEEVMMREEVRKRFEYSGRDARNFARAVRDIATVVKIKSDFKVIREDEKDNLILDTAYDGDAEYVVSGDKHLRKLKKFKSIRIVSPRRFMKIITEKFGEVVVPKRELTEEK